MGLATVAVHSEPDAEAPFVLEADEAVALGGTTAAESYLRIDAIIEAARLTGADAVHPGYGFLAENAAFARAVGDAGLVWIGPPPAAIEAMGSKVGARSMMEAAGVPVLPGAHLADDADEAQIAAEAERIGFPLLVKASAGGGGKGMRTVAEAAALADAVAGARREAESAFGDGTVFLERRLVRSPPRRDPGLRRRATATRSASASASARSSGATRRSSRRRPPRSSTPSSAPAWARPR